jgi:hypothetical protein
MGNLRIKGKEKRKDFNHREHREERERRLSQGGWRK